jgi:large subunit ribosomal protein L3
LKEGDRVTVEVFQLGDRVDVIGITKGKGFQGGMKRHHFRGGPATHGQSDRQRAPGSRGSTTTPGRVFKGSRGPGHMGSVRSTSINLQVVMVDAELNLLAVRGSVPGPTGAVVTVQQARKQ